MDWAVFCGPILCMRSSPMMASPMTEDNNVEIYNTLLTSEKLVKIFILLRKRETLTQVYAIFRPHLPTSTTCQLLLHEVFVWKFGIGYRCRNFFRPIRFARHLLDILSVARHTEQNYGTGMLKLWYTMVHVHKTYARREIQINIFSNTSNFNIFYK